MSFRQFGGMNYAPRHNIVASNYNTSNNLLVTQNVGQPNSYINFQSDISGNINIFGDLDVSGNVYANEFYITGPLATEPNSVVPKSYVDAIGSGLRPLPFCILCSNAGPITLSGNTQTIDGVTLNSSYNGEAILVNAQGGVGNNNINNGIYIIGSGAWSRASYLDTGDVATGTVTTIQSGLTYATYRFVCAVGTSSSPVNIGSPVVWSPYEIPFTLGQGLNRALVGNTTVLAVDSSLNFLTLVDASSSFPTLNIGTENATTINIGNNLTTSTNLTGPLAVSGIITNTVTQPASNDSSTKVPTTAWVQSAITRAVPLGTIVMWSGTIASIPTNWQLCNGTNGTPNLQDRFIVGAGNTYSVGGNGGEANVTLSTAEIPAHTHQVQDPGHNHETGFQDENFTDTGGEQTNLITITNAPNVFPNTTNKTTGISIINTGGGGAHNNLPPYYALAYIMRIS